jgi:hypothetical protein
MNKQDARFLHPVIQKDIRQKAVDMFLSGYSKIYISKQGLPFSKPWKQEKLYRSFYMITGDNYFYPPDYPGIPCNITTSAPGECVSISSVVWGVAAFSLALLVDFLQNGR